MIRNWLAAAALALLATPPGAQTPSQPAPEEDPGRGAARVYVFGNSLVNHLSERSQHTSVPYWLGQMAREEGRGLALDGQWGFLRGFAEGLPPVPNWSFPGVEGAWSGGDFGAADFDAVIVTPANFIQHQLPDAPYEGANPGGESPFGASLAIFDWLRAAEPEARLFVYEGWAEIAGVTGTFPPSAEAAARYHAFNAGDYHLWYRDLVAALNGARPGLQVSLIPVASALAGLFAEDGLLADLPMEALYTDADGHGTPTLYLLAAMVVYPALYEAPAPAGFRPPATLHPLVVERYAEIAEALWQERAEPAPAAAGAVSEAPEEDAAAAPLPDRQPVALPPPGLRPEGVPALGMGLNGLADWSTQHPFVNLMKTARPWVGHREGAWGAVTTEALRAGGHLSEAGWPLSLPEGVTGLESVLLTDQPEEASSLRGDYVVLYEGKGVLSLTGRARRIRPEPGRITFSYDPGEGLVGLLVKSLDPADPIRNIAVVREEMLPLHEAGALFNPAWLERVQDLRAVRFMDWMMTNGSPIRTWAERPRMEDATWTEWGVPAEVMIRLANRIGADPWFTLPHMADDGYVRALAEMVEAGLDPRLKAHVEYSNEVWNRIFPQALWAEEQATARWGASETGWAQFYALRAAQVMAIWDAVFEGDRERLVRVVATHTGWPGLEESILQAPLAYLGLGHAPVEDFDAYAVTGYFGYEMGGEEMAARMADWLDRSEAAARQAGEAEGLRRVALREYVRAARFDAAIAPVTLALEEGSLRQLIEEVFPYHAGVAEAAGLRLVMYEGGTHVAAHGAQVENERLTEFFAAFNYSPEMAKLYELLLAGWSAAGGTLFNAFVDVAPASKWGSWGALRHLDDANPRWDMLMAYNASGPNGWERRDPAAFANGVTAVAGAGDQRLEGTAQEDVLIGGPGDDLLVSGGGGDVLGGGPGRDRALLPLPRAAYALGREAGRLLLQGPDGTVILQGIEMLEFAGGEELATEGL